MDVTALIVAGLALVVSVLSAWSSHRNGARANRLAEQSLAEARSAKITETWRAAIEAANERMSLNPLAEDVAAPLRRSRAAFMALVDDLPEWPALGEWLAIENVLGAVCSHADMEDMDAEANRLPERQMQWGLALVSNLRRLRATGYDEPALHRLIESHRDQLAGLCAERGWEVPPERMAGIEPLDGDDAR